MRLTWDDEFRAIVKREWRVGQAFSLDDVYRFEQEVGDKFPENRHVRDKIRQVLQHLRDEGTIEFIDDRGNYRRTK